MEHCSSRSVGQTENQQPGQAIDWSQFPVPPGLSEYAFKRVIGENPPTAEQLEQTKLGIVKFLSGGFFPDSDILIHLIVAAADTRFSVANMADLELKKIVKYVLECTFVAFITNVPLEFLYTLPSFLFGNVQHIRLVFDAISRSTLYIISGYRCSGHAKGS